MHERARLLVTALVVATAVATGPAIAAAQTTPPSSAVTTGQDADPALVVDDARLHPSLAGVQVTGSGRAEVADAYRGALARRDTAATDLAATQGERAAAADEQVRVTAVVDEATADRTSAEAEVVSLRASLRDLAVQSYMRGGTTAGASVDLEAVDAELRQQAMVNTVSTNKVEELRRAMAVIDRSTRAIEEGARALSTLGARLDELATREADQQRQLSTAAGEVVRTRATLADWRLGSDVAGTDIPLVVLDAYVKAAERTAFERPECGLRWWGLAGIGKVESRHATFTGTRPGPDGVTLRQIIGIPLDGTNNTAVILDTDAGALDGDIFVDRAVGPMQFIPGTWRSLGRDATGDGRADPHNIYDAALSAAGLLCRAGGAGLDQPEPLRRAALGYNASGPYADLVVRTALDYAARADTIIPPPPPTPEQELMAALAAGLLPPVAAPPTAAASGAVGP
ncbi:MAG: hypothetical protein MUE36_05865 [Acidimicrobiales bacterium]|jgi:membrane-bound lytic murein transglycosylase B|nr:hypothetical protein [Acidimicrobiales bacterium]